MLERARVPAPAGLEVIAREAAVLAAAGDRERVVARLAVATPGAAFFSPTEPAAALTWVVDVALDGLAHGIAASLEGETVAAAVLDVARDECLSAHLGGGASGRAGALAVSDCADLAVATVETAPGVHEDPRAAVAVAREARALAPWPDTAIGLCRVARGEVDGCFARGLPLASYAAAALVAAEAGAVTELPCPENDGLVLAAAPGLHDALRRLVELPAR